MALLNCPCCGAPPVRRTRPITEAQARSGLLACLGRGVTIDQLMTEYAETLDYVSPGFLDWLRGQIGQSLK